jgi:hypothetical protein
MPVVGDRAVHVGLPVVAYTHPDEPELDSRALVGTPLGRLYRHLAAQLEARPELRRLRPRLPREYAEQLGHTAPPDHLHVQVVLAHPDALERWNAPANSLGLFAVSSGGYEHCDEDVISTAFRVVIPVDEARLSRHLAEERALELDPDSDRHDRSNLMAFIITLPHELAHALEYIEHGNGLTPWEAQTLHEGGDLPLELFDLVTGRGVREDMPAELDREEAIERMEARVEARGRALLDSLRLDEALVGEVIEHYGPRARTSPRRVAGLG